MVASSNGTPELPVPDIGNPQSSLSYRQKALFEARYLETIHTDRSIGTASACDSGGDSGVRARSSSSVSREKLGWEKNVNVAGHGAVFEDGE